MEWEKVLQRKTVTNNNSWTNVQLDRKFKRIAHQKHFFRRFAKILTILIWVSQFWITYMIYKIEHFKRRNFREKNFHDFAIFCHICESLYQENVWFGSIRKLILTKNFKVAKVSFHNFFFHYKSLTKNFYNLYF